MKFIHISDTHLGYHQYGLLERAGDFYDVFSEAVDFAVEKKVDFVLHTGDFFHTSRPSNQVILQGMEIVRRLNDANIPIFVISGNHDRGSQVRDVSPLSILQPVGLRLLDKGVIEYEGVFIGGLKYISHAGLRQINFREVLERYLEEMGSGFKIVMLHQEFQPFFPSSSLHPSTDIPEGFDYVGIGHYHVAQHPFQVNGSTVVYSGSTEFTAYNEKEEEKGKGFYYVDVSEGSINAQFVHLKRRRPFIFFEVLDEDSFFDSVKEKINSFEGSEKKPVLVLKGELKKLTGKEIRAFLEKEGLMDRLLHVQFNITKSVDVVDSLSFADLKEENLYMELQKLLEDKELSQKLVEVIQHLKTFDDIDEVKKFLKENPEIMEL
ncbi:metallophosphoesterase family protein [Persephonella sp.]